MEIRGKVYEVGTTQKITDKFSSRAIVIETEGKYQKKVAIEFVNDKIDMLTAILAGDCVTIQFDIESREHKGRWYTSARGWKLESAAVSDATPTGDLPF